MKTLQQAKGQVTLPREAREELGVKAGDELIWVKKEAGRWEICRFGDLVEDLAPTLAGLADGSRRAKRGFNAKRT